MHGSVTVTSGEFYCVRYYILPEHEVMEGMDKAAKTAEAKRLVAEAQLAHLPEKTDG